MKGGTGQPLLTADDVGDLHEVVIDDVGQVVGGEFVGTLVEYLVIQDAAVDDHLAADEVIDLYVTPGLYPETHHVLVTFLDEAGHFLGSEGQGVAHLKAGGGIILEVLHLLALGIEFLGGIEGDVCLAVVEEHLHVLLIDVAALALAVGTVVATEADAFVKLDAKPLETLNDVFLSSGNEAR